MVIKNKGQNVAEVQNSKTSVEVSLNSCIQVTFPAESKGMSFGKPGEYEYQGIDIVSREVAEEYKACANITRLTADGVRVLFILNSVEAKQDDLSQVLDIDILVLTDDDLSKVDRLAMLYNPKKIVVLLNGLKEVEVTETLKKTFSTSEITVDKQVKSKEDDFSSENFIVSFSILKK